MAFFFDHAESTLTKLSNQAGEEGSSLGVRACERLLDMDISKLKEVHIQRDKFKYEFIYQYPPPLTLQSIRWEDIFGIEAASRPSEPSPELAVYVHIPFCSGICSYCHYTRRQDGPLCVMDAYLSGIKKELDLYDSLGVLASRTVTSIHIGGGTPTYLTPDRISKLFSYLGLKLRISGDAEITCETNPETTSEEMGQVLLKAGITRLSIGIQAFDTYLLKVCSRRHTESGAVAAIKRARDVGFDNLNIDLIYGLPDQTFSNWEHTLATVAELKPESVTTYLLRLCRGTRMWYWAQTEQCGGRFPSEYESLVMHTMVIERLKELGYIQIAPNQFVLSPEYIYRHQEHKWRNGELLALGVSAYSYMSGSVYFNHRWLIEYMRAVRARMLPISIGRKLSIDEQVTRAVVLGLKLSGVNRGDGGVDKEAVYKAYGHSVDDLFAQVIAKLSAFELIKQENGRLELTYKGILFASEVCTEFYLSEDRKRLEEIGSKHGAYFPAVSREALLPWRRARRPLYWESLRFPWGAPLGTGGMPERAHSRYGSYTQ